MSISSSDVSKNQQEGKPSLLKKINIFRGFQGWKIRC